MIDRDIHLARALLIEGNAMLRSVAAEQLRSAGVGHVTQVARIKDARLLIEREAFDVIVCNREFEDSKDSGQDLLDELRRESQLPHCTVFMMITSQASYHQVVEAAEAALDGLLVRPYSAALLGTRLREARHRKRELADVLCALDSGQIEVALARALKRFQDKQPYATYCGRLVAELLLQLRRATDARLVFEKLASGGAIWARLGVSRAQLLAGDIGGARRSIEAVLGDEPGCADARDLMGRVLVEQCEFDAALVQYLHAAALTPGCLLRNQHAGALAFFQGQPVNALKLLEHALTLGSQSKLFDALTLFLIAVLRHDQSDKPGVLAMREQLIRYRERFSQSQRLQRLCRAADVLAALVSASGEVALSTLRQISERIGDPDFDLDAANILLMLWARVPEVSRPRQEFEAAVTKISMRFCVSKAITEVLMASAMRDPTAVNIIRRCQTSLSALTEEAMELSLRGDAEAAVLRLLDEGAATMNAKLLELAGLMAQRHRGSIPEAEALLARVSQFLTLYGRVSSHIAGLQRSGRSPGALMLRGRSPSSSDLATA